MKRMPCIAALLLATCVLIASCAKPRITATATGPCSAGVISDHAAVAAAVRASTMAITVTSGDESAGSARTVEGMGTVLGPNSLLTSSDLVRGARTISAIPLTDVGRPPSKQRRIIVRVETVAESAGVAMLAPVGNIPFFQLALPAHAGAPATGQTVAALSPAGTLHFGVIQDDDAESGGLVGLLETDLPSQEGASGAPLVDRCGNLEGVLLPGKHDSHTYFAPLDLAISALGIPCGN